MVIALTALYLIPRLSGLDTSVTIDEPHWLYRSGNFYSALWSGDLGMTQQAAHPGVTTMWAGTIGFLFAAPDYARKYPASSDNLFNQDINGEVESRLRSLGENPLDVLKAARTAKIGLEALLFAACVWLLKRQFTETIAITAGLLIALDPYTIGYDQLLHVDGLFAIASLLALLTLSVALDSGPEDSVHWVLAGAAASLVWLSRLPGLVMIATLVVAIVANMFLESRDESSVVERVRLWSRPLLLWGSSALMVTLILWPAWLVSPVSVAKQLVNGSLSMGVVEGLQSGISFMGSVKADPGPWFYPLSLLWRSTGPEFLGLLLFVVVLLGARERLSNLRTTQTLAVLSAYFILYGMVLLLSARKVSRYALPEHLILYVFASVGIVVVVKWFASYFPRLRSFLVPVGICAIVLIQASNTFAAAPYYIDTYNRILGGAKSAENVFEPSYYSAGRPAAKAMIADEWANGSGSGPNVSVRIPFVGAASVSYYLPSSYRVDSRWITSLDDWNQTNYYIVTTNEKTHDAHGFASYLEEFSPLYVVSIDGVDRMWIYRLSDIPAPSWLR